MLYPVTQIEMLRSKKLCNYLSLDDITLPRLSISLPSVSAAVIRVRFTGISRHSLLKRRFCLRSSRDQRFNSESEMAEIALYMGRSEMHNTKNPYMT